MSLKIPLKIPTRQTFHLKMLIFANENVSKNVTCYLTNIFCETFFSLKRLKNVFKPKLVFLLSPKTCIQLFFLLLPTLIQQILLFRCCQKYIGECVYYERLNQCFSYKKEPGRGGGGIKKGLLL
jgi:hypothetical protein